jgi:hypothetical protein
VESVYFGLGKKNFDFAFYIFAITVSVSDLIGVAALGVDLSLKACYNLIACCGKCFLLDCCHGKLIFYGLIHQLP